MLNSGASVMEHQCVGRQEVDFFRVSRKLAGLAPQVSSIATRPLCRVRATDPRRSGLIWLSLQPQVVTSMVLLGVTWRALLVINPKP